MSFPRLTPLGSQSASSLLSSPDFISESWKTDKGSLLQCVTETGTANTSVASSPALSDDKDSSVRESPRTALPTPFWPVSLQRERLEILKAYGGDQAPAIPDIYPQLPENETPAVVADAVSLLVLLILAMALTTGLGCSNP